MAIPVVSVIHPKGKSEIQSAVMNKRLQRFLPDSEKWRMGESVLCSYVKM